MTWAVIALSSAALVLLPLGLCCDMVAVHTCFPIRFLGFSADLFRTERSYSILSSIGELFDLGEAPLASLVTLFSVVVPIGKLGWLGWVIGHRLRTRAWKARYVEWLGLAGKWAMVEVFVVALFLVMMKAGDFVRAETRPGLYVFGASALASMAAIFLIEWHVRRSRPDALNRGWAES